MACFKANSSVLSCSSSSYNQRKVMSKIKLPKAMNTKLSLPDFTTTRLVEELALGRGYTKTILAHVEKSPKLETKIQDPLVIEKLYAIMEAISDRIEMHKNIGEQRNNWNTLLLTSINTITLTASIMAAISSIVASVNSAPAPALALKLSSTMLYLATTGILVIMNKLQPSQLVEEQRNATRLFKQLYQEMHTKVSIGNLNNDDVAEAMGKVLALDKAYPLPLLGAMLEKFPQKMEPAVWWPARRMKKARENIRFDYKFENKMREVIKVMERNDRVDYLRLGEKALKLNKMLAVCGPVLTGLGALGSALVGLNSWAVVVGVLGGAMASVVNTIQHGGQVGMVFEMYRCNAGFFNMMEEDIVSSLEERRESEELIEMKVALKLGRSLSELKDLVASSSEQGDGLKEFACKLF